MASIPAPDISLCEQVLDRAASRSMGSMEDNKYSIPDISDMPIATINRLLYQPRDLGAAFVFPKRSTSTNSEM
jgi:hypothetical protein